MGFIFLAQNVITSLDKLGIKITPNIIIIS